MTTWFTENSTFPMITGAMIVVALLGLAFFAREKIMLYAALVVAALVAGTVVCEKIIVTDREEIVDCVYELANAVQSNDKAAVVAFVSRNRQDTIDRVNAEMPRYDFDSCRINGTNYFKPGPDGLGTAEICFVVSVKVRLNPNPDPVWAQRKIILHFEKQLDGKWRIIDYSHHDPRGGLTM